MRPRKYTLGRYTLYTFVRENMRASFKTMREFFRHCEIIERTPSFPHISLGVKKKKGALLDLPSVIKTMIAIREHYGDAPITNRIPVVLSLIRHNHASNFICGEIVFAFVIHRMCNLAPKSYL